jgi:O-antigen ligase
MDKLRVIDKYAARLLMISFFLPLQLEVLVVIGMCVYFVARSFLQKEYPPKSNYLWMIGLSSIYLLLFVALPFTPPQHMPVLQQLFELRAAVIAVPVAVGVISPRFIGLILNELTFFTLGTFVMCAVTNGAFAYQYYVTKTIHELSHETYRVFFETFCGIHPTYMGIFLCFSICILLVPRAPRTKTQTILSAALLFVLMLFMLTLMPKASLIAIIVILIHYAFVNRKKLGQYKWATTSMVVAIGTACYLIPFASQRLKEVFSFLDKQKAESTVNNSVYIRKLIWDVNTSLTEKYWLTGVGPGAMRQVLRARYFFYSLHHQFFVGYYDPHSEYFTEWLSFGIAGIAVLLFILTAHFARAIRNKNLLYTYLMIIIAISFFWESVLARQHGVIFYTLFTSLFFFNPKPLKGPSQE